MSISILASFLPYAIVTSITPGPNNILALNASGRYGLRRSLRMLAGISTAFFAIMALCALAGAELATRLPQVMPVLKYIGAAYILWLAWHIAVSKPPREDDRAACPSFWKGFWLQFVNVKIIIYGLTLFSVFVLPYTQSPPQLLGFVLLATALAGGSTLLWAAAGAAFARFLRRYWRQSNIVMALVLVWSAISVLIT